MTSDDWDLQGWIEVFKKLTIEVSPVGVRFSINPLDGVKKLDGNRFEHGHEGNEVVSSRVATDIDSKRSVSNDA
jgi:hypothetical protein